MSLSAVRKGLADDLRVDAPSLDVYDHVPPAIDTDSLGTVVLEPSEDYLTRGETLNRYEVEVALDVVVLVGYAGENDTDADDLDDALEAFYLALPAAWLVTATGKPGPQTNGEWTAYGIRLTAATITSL